MPEPPHNKLDPAATAACVGVVVLWSTGPIFVKYLTGFIDSWTQNMFRYLSACLFWLPVLLYMRRAGRLDGRVWRRALLPGSVNVVGQSFFAAAFYYINPAFMDLLLKSSVIWIVVISLISFAQERPLAASRRFWLGGLLSAAGVIGVIVFSEDFGLQATMTGVALALTAGFFWAMYTLSVRISVRDIDSRVSFAVISMYTVAGLWIVGFIFGRPGEALQMGAWPWTCVVISGVSSIALGHVFYYAAIRRVGATIPALVLLSSPFVVFSVSAVVFGERFTVWQFLFGAVLLAGAALAILAQRDLR